MDSKERVKKTDKIQAACLISFFICIVFILLHCYMRKVWLFGKQSLLLGDAGEQYIYFMSELWDRLHSGGSVFYSRNAGMGYDFYTNAAYYLCSPFNIILLFVPRRSLEDAVSVIMVLKWAFCSVTMTYYALKTRKNKIKQARVAVAVTAGLAYSFSRFLLGYMFSFIWYDVIMLLPLLVLGMEDMIETGRWKRYYFLLTACMFCNFYMAFIVCLFLCILFLSEKWESFAQMKKKAVPFVAVSLLSALTSMVILLPCAVMQFKRYSGNITDKGTLDRFWELIKGMYIFRPLEGAVDLIPHLYMGTVFILIILAIPFIENTIAWKCRKTGVLLFFGMSFFIQGLNQLWHAGAVPHSYYQRFGFVVVFFVLQLFLEVLPQLSCVRLRYDIVLTALAFGGVVFSFFKETQLYDFYVYLAMFMLIVFYGMIFILYRKKSFTHKQFSYIICVVTIAELLVNAYVIFGVYEAVSPLKGEEALAVYRLNEQCHLEKGDRISVIDADPDKGMWLGKETAAGFFSFPNRKLMDVMHNMGISGFENDAAVEYNGGTPIDNIMFNIKYGIGKSEMCFSDAEEIAEDGGYMLFRMRRIAGLGYMARQTVSAWNPDEKNVFAMRNDFVRLAAGTEHIFKLLPADFTGTTLAEKYEPDAEGGFTYSMFNEMDGIHIDYTVPRDMDLYMYLNNTLNSKYFVEIDGEEVYENGKTAKNMMLHIGKVKADSHIRIIILVNAKKDLKGTIICQAAEFDEAAFNEAYSVLNRNTMQVDKYTDDCINAHINVEENGLLVTSIQAVDGMQVYVDNNRVSYDTVLGDSLLALPLTEGTHNIVVKYRTPYWFVGLLFSISGISIYVFATLKYGKRIRMQDELE